MVPTLPARSHQGALHLSPRVQRRSWGGGGGWPRPVSLDQDTPLSPSLSGASSPPHPAHVPPPGPCGSPDAGTLQTRLLCLVTHLQISLVASVPCPSSCPTHVAALGDVLQEEGPEPQLGRVACLPVTWDLVGVAAPTSSPDRKSPLPRAPGGPAEAAKGRAGLPEWVWLGCFSARRASRPPVRLPWGLSQAGCGAGRGCLASGQSRPSGARSRLGRGVRDY